MSRLRITAKGGIVALRALCAKSEAPTTNVAKKKQLLQAVKKSGRIPKDEPKKAKPKLCYIGFMQYRALQKKYVYRRDGGPDSIGLYQMQPSMISLILGNQRYL